MFFWWWTYILTHWKKASLTNTTAVLKSLWNKIANLFFAFFYHWKSPLTFKHMQQKISSVMFGAITAGLSLNIISSGFMSLPAIKHLPVWKDKKYFFLLYHFFIHNFLTPGLSTIRIDWSSEGIIVSWSAFVVYWWRTYTLRSFLRQGKQFW